LDLNQTDTLVPAPEDSFISYNVLRLIARRPTEPMAVDNIRQMVPSDDDEDQGVEVSCVEVTVE